MSLKELGISTFPIVMVVLRQKLSMFVKLILLSRRSKKIVTS